MVRSFVALLRLTASFHASVGAFFASAQASIADYSGGINFHHSVPELRLDLAVFEPMIHMKGKNMRASILAALLVAGFALPATAATHPVKGAVQGTAKAGKGVVTGAGQAGRGMARGTVTAARGMGRGAVCLFTLGTRCR